MYPTILFFHHFFTPSALDTNSPLPLLNSLTHLTYLTSTSPRIREILTCDGGLERLLVVGGELVAGRRVGEGVAEVVGVRLEAVLRGDTRSSGIVLSYKR